MNPDDANPTAAATQNEVSKADGVRPLLDALQSMRGRAPFAELGDVYRIAVRDHGYAGTIDDALRLLESTREVFVERGPSLNECRVFRAGNVAAQSF